MIVKPANMSGSTCLFLFLLLQQGIYLFFVCFFGTISASPFLRIYGALSLLYFASVFHFIFLSFAIDMRLSLSRMVMFSLLSKNSCFLRLVM